MKKGILDTIKWLDDPQETQQQRKNFCAKVVSARPTIEKLVKRMLADIAREYFGKLRNEVDQSYVNGSIDFGGEILNQVSMLEGEQNRPKEEQLKEPDVIHSGSVLEL